MTDLGWAPTPEVRNGQRAAAQPALETILRKQLDRQTGLTGPSVRVSAGRVGFIGRLVCRVCRPALGAWGEWIALRYLRKAGWDIVARNWRGRRGELDLVAFDGPYLVFVEVKTRELPAVLPPEDQIGRAKEEMLDRLIDEFTLRHELFDCPTRLDVIAIETGDRVNYQLRHYVDWSTG